MSTFRKELLKALGEDNAISDIRVVVRRLWEYEFAGHTVRLWDGKGTLITSGEVKWLGTITPKDVNLHNTPAIQDGRDGSSITGTVSITTEDFELYTDIKQDRNLATGQNINVYQAIFKEGEALRPSTPIRFFTKLTMKSPKFSETLTNSPSGLIKTYTMSVDVKGDNLGRSMTPNRTYADVIQREYANDLGVAVDDGAEYLSGLADRTYVVV